MFWKSLKSAVLVVLVVVVVADVVMLARSTLYNGDEIFNLDTILTFLTSGDYTTTHFGGYPFDPTISSGVLATWPFGFVILLGGSLFQARIFSGLLQLVAVVGFGWRLARAQGLGTIAAGVAALTAWCSLSFVAGHELRIINPGEVWGFAFGLAGLAELQRARSAPAAWPSPTVRAAFLWGLAAWLCKIIYLPIVVLFLGAQIVVDAHENDYPLASTATARAVVSAGSAFLVPLLAWFGVIAVRHDFATAASWLVAEAAFVVRHVTGITLDVGDLPGFAGWRFAPKWTAGSFLSLRPSLTLPALVPLASGPVIAAGWAVLKMGTGIPSSIRERAYLGAATIVVVLFAVWFLGFDPTQWGRHLLPAIYVSVAMGTYCLLDLRTMVRLPAHAWEATGLTVCALVAWTAWGRTRADLDFYWRGSYAKTCHSLAVLERPCKQEKALGLVADLVGELCDIHDRGFDEDCIKRNRVQFFARAVDWADQRPQDPKAAYTAGYVMLFVGKWAYFEKGPFVRDLERVLCVRKDPLLWRYLEEAGVDVDADDCARAPSDAGSQGDRRTFSQPRYTAYTASESPKLDPSRSS